MPFDQLANVPDRCLVAIRCKVRVAYNAVMKPPQFSLRMILLLTALVAVTLAWRQAADRYWRIERPRSNSANMGGLHQLHLGPRSAVLFCDDPSELVSDEFAIKAWIRRWYGDVSVNECSGGWWRVWNVKAPRAAIDDLPDALLETGAWTDLPASFAGSVPATH